jgi:hypothetical protein
MAAWSFISLVKKKWYVEKTLQNLQNGEKTVFRKWGAL